MNCPVFAYWLVWPLTILIIAFFVGGISFGWYLKERDDDDASSS